MLATYFSSHKLSAVVESPVLPKGFCLISSTPLTFGASIILGQLSFGIAMSYCS